MLCRSPQGIEVDVEVFMGLQNRDYFRADYESNWSDGGSDTPVVKRLLIVTIAVFVLQILTIRQMPSEASGVRQSLVQSFLELDSAKVMSGQIWRLVTYCFCHTVADPWHIVLNMLGLWWFGRILEQMYGSREFLWFYLVAALISGLAFVGLDLATNQGIPAVGASGSVMAVLCLFAWHFPTQIIRIFFVIPMEVRWLVILYAVFDFYPVLLQLSGQSRTDGVAHAAHVGGLVFGFFYGRQSWRLSTRFERWNWGTNWRRLKARFRRGPKLSIHRPGEVNSEYGSRVRLDELLAKISEQGEASLTAEERQFLIKESERLKRQR
ncbi:MAG: rhomboid family intramembrane serine protease [Planctomycetota bacterium]